ncbi:MAG: hypothetical protein BWK76_01825 [Desulfobulbaceae bacterium A2]|nr:MAG: hypothetical protein BWK76_01825 [Desulfobulbaceae bacterium A2]
MPEKKTILFVDDEPLVLNALRRMMHPLSRDWTMHFAESGAQALEICERETVHVIVSDMRMPTMSGHELLQEVRRLWPRTVRVILTGQPDQETHSEALAVTHYFLWKPTELPMLQNLLDRIGRLDSILTSEPLQNLLGGLDALPSMPELFVRLTRMLERRSATIDEISSLISHDMGMTAQLLKTVNSAFLGLRRNITSLREAVMYLGLDVIRSLVLIHHLFVSCDRANKDSSLRALWEHSLLVGGLAQRIAEQRHASAQAAGDAFLAGLLHDAGKLILACKLPEVYTAIIADAADGNWADSTRERELLGTDHAAIGAYLAGLWGLPQQVVEAIALHHASETPQHGEEFLPLTAVWHAERLSHGDASQSAEFAELAVIAS